MAVDRLAITLSGGDFPHQLWVLVDDAGVVHHLREVINVGHGHQLFDVVGVEGGACRFEGRGRHAARCAKEELEGYLLTIVDHITDAFLAQDIGDFVRVADGGHRAVTSRQTGKLRRHKHGAFDVHMGVDEARHDVLCVADRLLFYLGDLAVFDDDDTREDPGIDEVNDLTADGKSVVH